MTIASSMSGGLLVYDPRYYGGVRASGRANSSAAAAIVIDVASSRYQVLLMVSLKKLEATTAGRVTTYSR